MYVYALEYVCDPLMTTKSSPAISAVTLALKPPRRISNHNLMEPIDLMKYICVTEIIHLNFGKRKMLLFGIQKGKLSWSTLGNFAVSPECFRL